MGSRNNASKFVYSSSSVSSMLSKNSLYLGLNLGPPTFRNCKLNSYASYLLLK